jgi:hypothetical protein
MTYREQLIEQSVALGVVIRSSEEWQDGYKKDPKSFKKLVKNEVEFEHALRDYFKGLYSRLSRFVDWRAYRIEAIKAYDVVVDVKSEAFKGETDLLLNIMITYIETAQEAGFEAASDETGIGLAVPDLQAAILKSVNLQGEKSVKNITDTTRNIMQQSIQTSMKLGETDQQAAARLERYVTNPSRALTIARTENVKAYNQGIKVFGKATGASQKIWHCVAEPCKICEPNSEQVVDIDEDFNSGDDTAPAHPNCRCRVMMIYTQSDGSTDEGDEE